MYSGIFFIWLFVLSGSLVVQCRHVPLAKSSISLVNSNDNKQQAGHPTIKIEDRYYDEAQEGFDSSELFDGLTLASDGYVHCSSAS